MITFGTSAFWHGVAGGYYLAFFYAGFVQTVMRQCRAHLRPLFLVPAPAAAPGAKPEVRPTALKPLYDVAGVVVSVSLLNYSAAPFMLLSIRDSLAAWGRLGWYGHWLIGVPLVFFWAGGARLLPRTQTRASTAPKNATMNGTKDISAGPVPPVNVGLKELK
jgi:lysophospholipid acyltransferase